MSNSVEDKYVRSLETKLAVVEGERDALRAAASGDFLSLVTLLNAVARERDQYQQKATGWASMAGTRADTIEILQITLSAMTEALLLFVKYAPLSGDIALMIRATQPGGEEAHEHANKLIEFYEHLNEAHDKGRAALANARRASEETAQKR